VADLYDKEREEKLREKMRPFLRKIEIYRKLRPGEPHTMESAHNLFHNLFDGEPAQVDQFKHGYQAIPTDITLARSIDRVAKFHIVG